MSRIWLMCLGFAAAGCADDPLSPQLEDPLVEQFVELVNEHRVNVGCGELAWNADVAAVAQAHSDDMEARSYFSHTNPDGASPFDRLDAAGIGFSLAAENIANGYPTAEAVLAGWLGSAGHKANIENCSLHEHGLGLRGALWTHVFITP